ncbi:MAG: iron-sulfur cluster assembly accessory protein [Chthoniobacteraceae bacterium]
MITVTDSAVQQLKLLLADHPEAAGKGLRLYIEKGGCAGLQYGMSVEAAQPGDTVIEQDGVQFIVDAASVSYLQGSVIDYDDGLSGAGFRINNPNAARSCGCGTSFEPAETAPHPHG